MSTAAQIAANQSNAQHSTGPVTAEGKARVSQNAVKLGLFSTANFVRPEEREIFENFTAAYTAELSPASPLEQTLAREIVQAAWRLRRCATIESAPPETDDPEQLDRLQASIDRARASAQRSFHRSLAELRRLQTERVYRQIVLPGVSCLHANLDNLGQASCSRIDAAALILKQAMTADALAMQSLAERQQPEIADSAKQTQFQPAPAQRNAPAIARNAPCPCGSREKYKRCCGKNAPPVLGAA